MRITIKSKPKVSMRSVVVGYSKAPAQVFVKASDGKWYLQRPIERISSTNIFRCVACVGDEATSPETEMIVAVVQTEDRTKGVYDELPAGEVAMQTVIRR